MIRPVFTKSRQHVCHVRRKIQMSDVGFVKIIIIWCLRLPIGRRRVKSIREDCKTTSVQVMAWCHQATSHFLNQCWLSSIMQHSMTITWLQWVKTYMKISICSSIKPLHNVTIFSCGQAALRTLLSVRQSVCLSVCLSVTPFSLCSCHRIIMKFSELLPLTKVMSMQEVKVRGQRSKSEVMTPLSRFRTVTPLWIHIWWWNDAQSLMLLRRGALLFFKVICQISRSHGSKKRRFWPKIGRFRTVTPVWIHQWLWNDTQSLKQQY